MEMKNGIQEAAGYTHFVLGVVIFPDMERNARMEEVAQRKNHVYIIWGLANLQDDLKSIARKSPFNKKPKPNHSENECSKVRQLQYRGPDDRTDQETPAIDATASPPLPGPLEQALKLGSATINIQHVETLVIQHGPQERDIEGQTYMSGL